MKINRTNYEVYVIDYFDQKLAPVEVAELLLFLEQNPDIKTEFETLSESFVIKADTLVYPFKEQLKQPINSTTHQAIYFQNLLLDFVENNIAESDTSIVEEKIKTDAAFKNELHLFRQTILQPDNHLVYPEKQKLKKSTKLISMLYYSISAVAAMLIFVFAISFFSQKVQPNISTQSITPNSLPAELKQKIAKQAPFAAGNLSKPTLIFESPKTAPNKQKTIPKEHLAEIELQPISVSKIDELQLNTGTIAANTEIENVVPKSVNSEDLELEERNYLSVNELVRAKFKKFTRGHASNKSIEKTDKLSGKISKWDIAAMGAKLVSKLSGNSIEVKNDYNEQGQLKQFAIISKDFEFSKSR